VRDAKLFASHVTRYPYLYWNRHRSSTDPFYPRITSNCVPYPYWLKKRHPFHRNGHNACIPRFRRTNSAAQVHLGGYPSTENVALWISVHWHGNRLDNQFASGLLGHLERIIAQSAVGAAAQLCRRHACRHSFLTRSACNHRSCKNGNVRGSPRDKRGVKTRGQQTRSPALAKSNAANEDSLEERRRPETDTADK